MRAKQKIAIILSCGLTVAAILCILLVNTTTKRKLPPPRVDVIENLGNDTEEIMKNKKHIDRLHETVNILGSISMNNHNTATTIPTDPTQSEQETTSPPNITERIPREGLTKEE